MSKKMRINIIGSATSIHTVKWANFLASKGHVVIIHSFVARNPSLMNEIRVYRVPKFSQLKEFLFYIPKLKSEVKMFSPDVVQVHSMGSYALLSLFFKSKNKVMTPWGSDVLLFGHNFFKWIVLLLAVKSANYFTCDSQEVRAKLISLGADHRRIYLVNFGVDTTIYRKLSSKELNVELGLRPGFPIVVSTRSFETIYDLPTLLYAMSHLNSQGIYAQLLLIGSGSTEDELRYLSDKLGLQDQVIFAGRVENSELPIYLNSSDIYVSTSLSDAGIAASTAEAMSCELPCIITDVRENRWWIQDSVNGFLFEQKNSKDLAALLRRLIESPEISLSIGEKAREKIILSNDFVTEMSKVESIYSKGGNID